MSAGGEHRKKGLLSALSSGITNALGGMFRKKDSAESDIPEEPVEEETRSLSVEPIADEPVSNGPVHVESNAEVPQEPMAISSIEEVPRRACSEGPIPEETAVSDASPDVQDEKELEPEPQTKAPEVEETMSEGSEEAQDAAPLVTKPKRTVADVDKLSLVDLDIASFVRSSFERFGIYMVAELLFYRREELIELHGITQKTLSMIELRVASRTGQAFHLQGSSASGPLPRRMTREEMIALDVGLSELRISPLVMRQLRRNNIFGCRQIAFTSRDELLDYSGIDLETTYELEEALGALLGVRVVLGCDRGEPPTVVDGEPPYSWRLQKNEVEEPRAADNVEEKREETTDDINQCEPADEPLDEELASSELAKEGNFSSEADTSAVSQPDPPDEATPFDTADDAGACQPKVAEDHPKTVVQQDDGDWDDVFGEVYESEWDDASKWDWIYGEVDEPEAESDEEALPDYQGAVGIAEWVSSQDGVSSKLLTCLLDGMSKTQAAAECKVPTSTVDFLVLYVLNHRPPVREDEHAHAFKNYAMSLEEFIDIFGQPALTYRYLTLTCEPGTKSISEMLDDEHIPESAKDNLRLRLRRINPIPPNSTDERTGASNAGPAEGTTVMPACASGEDCLRKLRVSIEARAVFGTEYSVDFFYKSQSTLMNELGIETSTSLFQMMQEAFKDSPEVTFHEDRIVRFGKADHDDQILALIEEMSPATFGDLACQYKAKYGVGYTLFRIWLHKFYRYQRNGTYDISYGRPLSPAQMPNQQTRAVALDTTGPVEGPETSKEPAKTTEAGLNDGLAEDHIVLPQGMRNDLRELATAILSVAKMNTEYSTNYFYNLFPDLRRGLKVGSRRHFNELVKQALRGCRGVSFPSSGYFVRFGECNRNRQIIRLMREMSPVTAENLRKEYERRYGVGQSTLYGWFYCIHEYRKGDTYAVEYGSAIVEPVPSEPDATKQSIESPLSNTTNTVASISPASEGNAEAEQASQTQHESCKSKSVPDRDAVLRSIRETIDSIASSDTEYSTDYFYEALPELVTSVRAGSKMDFFYLVEEAYKNIEGVRFPMGHAMVLGDGNRDRQMLALLKELSPSQPMDLANAYEKRYGFSRYLVQRWYRKYSEYLENGYYTYKETGVSDAASETPSISVAELDETSPSNIIKGGKPKTDEELIRLLSTSETPTPDMAGKNTKRLPRTQSAPKPRTALEWALSLEGIERQVVQQTLFGNSLYSVAANASLSLKEASELLISTISKCPTVHEDSFLIHFKLSKSMREFCNGSGEPEATYHFLSWRSKTLDQASPNVGGEGGIESDLVRGKSQASVDAAEQRRQMRAAARARERAWQSERVDNGMYEGQGQGEEQAHPASNGLVTHGIGLGSKSVRPVLGLAAERRVVQEVDRIATVGKEYAPAYFYRVLLSTMRELGIHSDDELLDVMRHAYRRDSEVSFVDGNVIRFGKCDRRRQLEDFLAEDPTVTLGGFVSGYERKYGFSRVRVTRWLAEYGIYLTTDQLSNDPVLDTIQSLIPIDLPDASTNEPTIQANKLPTTKRQRTSTRQAQMELPISTKRVGRVSRTTEYADFLRSELTADCCDRSLVTERFRSRFPEGPKDPFNEQMLWRLGFNAKGKKLLFREGVRYEEYFENLIDSRVMFARGDADFENAIFNDPQFRRILRRKMRSFAVVEYEKDSFISTAHLCEQMGVTIADIQGYSQDVVAQLRDRVGAPAPFTVWSLRNQYGIRHPLDALKLEGGMSDFVYETLFDIDPHVQCCTISKKRGFLETDGDFDTGNFIECIIEMNGPMEIDDLIDLLRDAYGINYPELPLHHTISMSSLYYDDITDSVFNSRHEWEEMVNRELA